MKHLILAAALFMVGCGTDDEPAPSCPAPETCTAPDASADPESTSDGTGGAAPAPTATSPASGGSAPTPEPVEVCDCPEPIPGPAGEMGSPGADGSSCSVAQTPTGAAISCTDGTLAELTNGSDGAPGADGQSIVGPMGPTGPAGADSTVPGPAGPQGERGERGDVGPAGERGEVGATGATGATGPAGTDGVDGASITASSLYVVQYGEVPTTAGLWTVTVYCDAGDVAVGGGCSSYKPNGPGTERLINSRPIDDAGTPTGWYCTAGSLSTTHQLDAYVICLDVP